MNINSKQVYYDEFLFDSETESEYYKLLKAKKEMGSVSVIIVKPQYVLVPPFEYMGKQIKGVVYTPDFEYITPDGTHYVIEVKGYPTPDFELRLKLWKYQNPSKQIFVMQYSKSTGWVESTEYPKARARITKENAIKKKVNEILELEKEIQELSQLEKRTKTQEKMLKRRLEMLKVLKK